MKSRALWLDNLRSFIILLVVAHHAACAYTTYGSFNKAAYIFSSHAIVDTQRWIGMDWFIYFNDIFMMALMFFISGLFATSSLRKKGAKAFLGDRFNRLFITFAVGATLLMFIIYFPSYMAAYGDFNIKKYIIDFFTAEYWPSAHVWFIWVLFIFNLVFALTFKFTKGLLDKLSNALLFFRDKPFLFFIAWYIFSWILYVPMRMKLGAYTWTGIGPFDLQQCTVLMYFGYFILGAVFGNISQENGIFSDSFTFLKRWKVWTAMCFISFISLLLIDNPSLGNPLAQFGKTYMLSRTTTDLIYCCLYVATLIFICIAILSVFKNLVNYSNKFWDSLAPNSFFIYLIHYIFITWLQYSLLQIVVPVYLKFLVISLIAISISWYLGYFFHKNTRISKYV